MDVTSGTKEAAIAASLLGELYDITISYVPPKAKLEKMKGRDLKEQIDMIKSEAEDPGQEPLYYRVPYSPLEKDEVLFLNKAYQKDYKSIADVVEEVARETKKKITPAFRRYWTRVASKLESAGLIETVSVNKKAKRPSLTIAGKGLIRGTREAS